MSKQQPEQALEIHQAVFAFPQGVLNPLGVRMAAPIEIEVFEVRRGSWVSRYYPISSAALPVSPAPSAIGARYAAARLFGEQWEPWTVKRQRNSSADRDHLHYSLSEPSLCGSRFHQAPVERITPKVAEKYPLRGNAVPVGHLRAGKWYYTMTAAEIAKAVGRICPQCWSMLSTQPEADDLVKARPTIARGRQVAGPEPLGVIVSHRDRDAWNISWAEGPPTTERRDDFELIFLRFSVYAAEEVKRS